MSQSELEEALKTKHVIYIQDENPQPQIGWKFDTETNKWSSNGASISRKITQLAFMDRFTFSELITITTAAKTSVAVEVLMNKLNAATYIDLDRTDTQSAVGFMVQSQLLTQARMVEILSAPVADKEIYTGK
jgi:hypothetical protein